ncbi:hypothetical protein D3C87_1797310 [compost metagenome]
MAVAGSGANAEGNDQAALGYRKAGKRLPGDHHALAGDGRIEHQRGLVEGVTHPQFGTGKPDLPQPDLPGEHRMAVNDSRDL